MCYGRLCCHFQPVDLRYRNSKVKNVSNIVLAMKAVMGKYVLDDPFKKREIG